MTGDEGHIVAQWPELLRDRIDQVLVIAHGEIRTPDAALKEYVADDGELAGAMEENHVAGRVAGAVEAFQLKIADGDRLALFQPAVRRHVAHRPRQAEHLRLVFQLIEQHLVGLVRPDDLDAQRLLQFHRSACMVDMAMRQPDRLKNNVVFRKYP